MDLQQSFPSNVSKQYVNLLIDLQFKKGWKVSDFLNSVGMLDEKLKLGLLD